MKKVGIRMAMAAATLVASLGAQAGVLSTTITFDPVDTSTLFFPPLLVHGDEFYQPGIDGHTMFVAPFSNAPGAMAGDLVGAIVDGTDLSTCSGVACPSNNPTNFMGMLNDGVVVFGAQDGFTFSVKNLDASFIGNGDPLPATPGYLALQGVRGGSSLTAYFALTGPDANGKLGFSNISTGDFGSFEFDYVYAFAYACRDSSCTAFGTDRAQFALDNIQIEHVPEPASLALFAIAGLAASRATRRRAA